MATLIQNPEDESKEKAISELRKFSLDSDVLFYVKGASVEMAELSRLEVPKIRQKGDLESMDISRLNVLKHPESQMYPIRRADLQKKSQQIYI